METYDVNLESVKHWILESRSGYQYMRFECPICKIWIDGPVFIEQNGVHMLETFPTEWAHEIVDILSCWQQRLIDKAEIPIDKLHIHVQMLKFNINPCGGPVGLTQYFISGKLITTPREYIEGKYDTVLIRIAPDSEITVEELEELLLHELIHVAYPTSGSHRTIPLTTSIEDFFEEAIAEEWVRNKTKELFSKHGYYFIKRRVTESDL